MGEKKNEHRVLVGNSEEEGPVEKLEYRWADDIEMD